MSIDGATLTLYGGLVTIFSGVFLLAYWAQDCANRAVLLWGAANVGAGAGVVLMAFGAAMPPYVAHFVAPRLLDGCGILAFLAARIFNRGSIRLPRAAAGLLGLALLPELSFLCWGERAATVVGLSLLSCVYMAAAVEFWLGRGEPLPGRRPIVGLVGAFAISLALLALHFTFASGFTLAPSRGRILVIDFIVPLYAVGVAVFLVAMSAARREKMYRNAALRDPLTGLANRAAFMETAPALFDKAGTEASPVALLAFDLDRFKMINDAFGHAVGDRTLCVFAGVAASSLRPSDLVARMGGEEFVAVAPGADAETALALARGVCLAFQLAAQSVDGRAIAATVSVGVATNGGGRGALADALAAADSALYQAKKSGRNRVVLAPEHPDEPFPDNVVRMPRPGEPLSPTSPVNGARAWTA